MSDPADATSLIADILAEHFSGVRLPAGEFDNAAVEAIAADVRHRLDRAGYLMPELTRRVANGDGVNRAVRELAALVMRGHEDRWIAVGEAQEHARWVEGKGNG